MESVWKCLESSLKSFECVNVMNMSECIFISHGEGAQHGRVGNGVFFEWMQSLSSSCIYTR